MRDRIAHIDRIRSVPPPRREHPIVVITGAGRGVGRACAEALAERGAELIVCDNDREALAKVADMVGAVGYVPCDVASEASVAAFAADVVARYQAIDMVINAAGGGYQRTLGMYRVSRALLPALKLGALKLVVNIPPSRRDADVPTFPYASSRLAFQRLSSALALEVRGTGIAVLIACPANRQLSHVFPDPDAGAWSDNRDLRQPSREDMLDLARQVAALAFGDAASRRQAG
jgi:NAD(P)-dependent dehydrogenase (short-subunit alcohol dehydrogenase family)